ncbi:hypothetical protein ACVW19_002442 [Streptomyces sp. TE5632]
MSAAVQPADAGPFGELARVDSRFQGRGGLSRAAESRRVAPPWASGPYRHRPYGGSLVAFLASDDMRRITGTPSPSPAAFADATRSSPLTRERPEPLLEVSEG